VCLGYAFPGARESLTFSIPELLGMKLTQFLGTRIVQAVTRITVIGGYPVSLRVMGFLKISNVTLAISGVFRRGLVWIKTPSTTLLMKYFHHVI